MVRMRDGERRGSTEAGQRGNQDVKAALGKAKVGLGYLADATKTVGVEIMTAYNEAGDWRGGAGRKAADRTAATSPANTATSSFVEFATAPS